ncbi:hypothetical protein LCGC14_0660410 [marine sediment metagenome]|uniref:Uncharacterized protein n=1 Tax=marine sediment metagenome TaxID=412755 RepID=A0A0F9U233_9ZZZZ
MTLGSKPAITAKREMTWVEQQIRDKSNDEPLIVVYAATLDNWADTVAGLESRIEELEAELAHLKLDKLKWETPDDLYTDTFTDARGGNPRIPFP